MTFFKPPTGSWAVSIQGRGETGRVRRQTRIFNAKADAVRFARRRRLYGDETQLWYAHVAPLWERRALPETEPKLAPDGESERDVDGPPEASR